jgi:hypothetical protein
MQHKKDVSLDELRECFAAFHDKNPRNTRIPVRLRTAVVAAIGRGIPPTRLRHACGISTSQLVRWQAGARTSGKPGNAVPRPRVFSVVDAPAISTAPAAPTVPPMSEDLELRLGRWTVSVRMAGQPTIGRG